MYAFLINTATVILGATIGMGVGARLQEKYKTIILQALGLITLVIGFRMATRMENMLVIVASLVIGGLIGEWLAIEKGLERLGEYLKRKAGFASGDFALGFVSASLLFCVGPMTIVGSLEDGLYGRGEVIYIKSMMDGFSSMSLAAAFGSGVLLAALVVLVYQGALTFLGRYLQVVLMDHAINEMSAAGGVLVVGLGINLLGIHKVRVANLIPALPLAALAVMIWG